MATPAKFEFKDTNFAELHEEAEKLAGLTDPKHEPDWGKSNAILESLFKMKMLVDRELGVKTPDSG